MYQYMYPDPSHRSLSGVGREPVGFLLLHVHDSYQYLLDWNVPVPDVLVLVGTYVKGSAIILVRPVVCVLLYW